MGGCSLGLILMSERELQRIEVLSRIIEQRMSITAAARVLELTARQVQRLVKTFQADGAAALRHKSRGQPSNNRYATGIADLAVQLVREHYIDFGPTLAAEKLTANHGLTVSRETLRKWMAEAGIWLSRKQRRTFHQPRLRRESLRRTCADRRQRPSLVRGAGRSMHSARLH